MTLETTQAADILDRPCIARFGNDVPDITLAEYDAAQREWWGKPVWAHRAPRVEHLTTEPGVRDIRIVDQEAYDAQMWALIGLPELAERR
jgi:hypothetical protein